MTTGATLFSGGELAGVGMRQAGIDHRWGIEIDDAIANVARANGFHVITADVLDIDPTTMEPVDVLHASPPCTRASNANQSAELNEDGTKEAPLDIALGEKVAEFIGVLRPRIVTIENVYAYRNFKAFGLICEALNRGGYFWDYDNLNAADFGVPQTRRRLFLRAVKGALLPPLPAPEPWVGWFEAIADLIPTLPDSQFAKWQQIGVGDDVLISGQYGQPNTADTRTVQTALKHEPSFTVTTGAHKDWRCQVNHHQYKISMQAIIRFQSVPDSYVLPDKAALACKVIGNGVACLMIEKIYRQLVSQ